MGFRLKNLALLPLLLWAELAFAGVEQISESEFRDLAQNLSTKVNLFKAGWEKDPKAEFYGGTTRDYLYWLKGQFVNAHSPAQAAEIVKKLKNLPIIDVRDFIIGDSDVDVISNTGAQLNAQAFGVRKIDSQSPDILNPEMEIGKNEILQGYIPAEKIRLASDGFPPTTLGDGIHEIYEGKLSVHFASAEDFAQSKYAKEGINHPILLAIRYLRLQAINYYRSYGSGVPDQKLLLSGMDDASARAVKEVIEQVRRPHVLDPFLAKNKFRSWANGGIQKSFRSYTNPTAALELMRKFGVDKLPDQYPEIETLNQYVFSKYRDEKKIAQAFTAAGIKPDQVYKRPDEYFADGKLYHGTKNEPAFRGILFQGVLPSEGGTGGNGLYGVAEANKSFSEKWAGDKNRLLRFPVDPNAKIIDVTEGEGQKLWEKAKLDYEQFADRYGADILRYPYDTQAFVVKNGAVLGKAEGVHRTVMSLAAMMDTAAKTRDVEAILSLMSANQVSSGEAEMIWKNSPVTGADVAEYLQAKALKMEGVWERDAAPPPRLLLDLPLWQDDPRVQKFMADSIQKNSSIWANQIAELLLNSQNRSPAFIVFLDGIIPRLEKNNLFIEHLIKGPLRDQAHIPNAVKFLMGEMSSQASREKLSGYGLGLLAHANLDDQTEHAWEIYRNLHGIQPKDSAVYLASALLRAGSHPEEIKARLLSELAPKLDSHFFTNRLELLGEYFPSDPAVQSVFGKFAEKYLKDIVKEESYSLDEFSQLTKNMGSPQKVKDDLFEIAEAAKKIYDEKTARKTHYILERLTLSDEDWLKFFKQNTPTVFGMESFLKTPHSNPDLSRALIDAYIGAPSKDLPEAKKILIEAINENVPPEMMEKYLLGLMDQSIMKFEGMLRLSIGYYFNGLQWPYSPKLEKAILAYLGTPHAGPTEEAVLMKRLQLEDEAVAEKVQKLYLKRGGHHNIALLASVSERMPRVSPEFREFLVAQATTFEKSGRHAPFVERLRKRLQDDTCHGKFANLAP